MDDKSALLEYENPGEGEAENALALLDEEALGRYVFCGELDEKPLLYELPRWQALDIAAIGRGSRVARSRPTAIP